MKEAFYGTFRGGKGRKKQKTQQKIVYQPGAAGLGDDIIHLAELVPELQQPGQGVVRHAAKRCYSYIVDRGFDPSTDRLPTLITTQVGQITI